MKAKILWWVGAFSAVSTIVQLMAPRLIDLTLDIATVAAIFVALWIMGPGEKD